MGSVRIFPHLGFFFHSRKTNSQAVDAPTRHDAPVLEKLPARPRTPLHLRGVPDPRGPQPRLHLSGPSTIGIRPTRPKPYHPSDIICSLALSVNLFISRLQPFLGCRPGGGVLHYRIAVCRGSKPYRDQIAHEFGFLGRMWTDWTGLGCPRTECGVCRHVSFIYFGRRWLGGCRQWLGKLLMHAEHMLVEIEKFCAGGSRAGGVVEVSMNALSEIMCIIPWFAFLDEDVC